MKLSIIISTYNFSTALNDVLFALISQAKSLNIDSEILIADDGSDEKTKSIIEKHYPKFSSLKHIWHDDSGFRKSSILNKAVAKSSGDYLIFLDGDCVPLPHFLENHLSLIEKNYFVAGHRVLLSEAFTKTVSQFTMLSFPRLFLAKKVNKLLPFIENKMILFLLKKIGFCYWRSYDWKFPKGCNFAVFKSDFIAVNGFDEKYEGWGHEDSDLFIRLLHHGIKIKDGKFLIPVLHLWHPSAPRDKASENFARQEARAKDLSIIHAEKGIDQYIDS